MCRQPTKIERQTFQQRGISIEWTHVPMPEVAKPDSTTSIRKGVERELPKVSRHSKKGTFKLAHFSLLKRVLLKYRLSSI
jgi:hypothetical protein